MKTHQAKLTTTVWLLASTAALVSCFTLPTGHNFATTALRSSYGPSGSDAGLNTNRDRGGTPPPFSSRASRFGPQERQRYGAGGGPDPYYYNRGPVGRGGAPGFYYDRESSNRNDPYYGERPLAGDQMRGGAGYGGRGGPSSLFSNQRIGQTRFRYDNNEPLPSNTVSDAEV